MANLLQNIFGDDQASIELICQEFRPRWAALQTQDLVKGQDYGVEEINFVIAFCQRIAKEPVTDRHAALQYTFVLMNFLSKEEQLQVLKGEEKIDVIFSDD